MIFSDGWILRDAIVYRELDHRGFICGGFRVESPDFGDVSNISLDSFTKNVQSFVAELHHEEQVQISWSVETDYSRELAAYREKTKTADLEWVRKVRDQISDGLETLNAQGDLRKERNYIFFTKKINDLKKGVTLDGLTGAARSKKAAEIFDSFETYIGSRELALKQALGFDCAIDRLKNDDLIRAFASKLAPDVASNYNPKYYDYYRTIFENLGVCKPSYSREPEKYGFYHDGFFHSVISLKQLPESTSADMMTRLTNLHGQRQYSVTVNIATTDIERQMAEDRKSIKRLRADAANTSHEELESDISKRKMRLLQMAEGQKNHKIEIILHCWDKDTHELMKRVQAIKNTIISMNGALYWEDSERVTQIKQFYLTLPGWTYSRYNGYRLNITSHALSKILPFSSTFSGFLEDAQAIFLGNRMNPVGVKIFLDSTPQMAAIFGTIGSGKSFNVTALLSQILNIVDYLAVIEEGNSYGMLMLAVGGTSLYVQPDSDQRLNYWDTNGNILTSEHINNVRAILLEMCGIDKNPSVNRKRSAILEKNIRLLYGSFIERWQDEHREESEKAARYVYTVNRYQKEKLGTGKTYLDAWIEVRDILKGDEKDDEAQKWLNETLGSIGEESLTDFITSDEGQEKIRNSLVAWFGRSDFPTHHDFVDLLRVSGAYGRSKDSDIRDLMILLEKWSDTIFDGVSNVETGKRIDHFELGNIPKAAEDLKNVAVFTINAIIRQNILNRPRNKFKGVIYEEAKRFIETELGRQILLENYAQFRKYAAWPLFVTQQFLAGFDDKEIRATVMGNSSLLMVMLQKSREDLAALQDIKRDLSDMTCEKIMRYPPPATLPADQRYSSFTYYHDYFPKAKVGTINNYVSREVAFVAATDGAAYERRKKLMAGEKNIIEAIWRYANDPDALKNAEGKIKETPQKEELSNAAG